MPTNPEDLYYVTADGDYGVGVITFRIQDISSHEYDQLVDDIAPSDRYDYVKKLLTGRGEQRGYIHN